MVDVTTESAGPRRQGVELAPETKVGRDVVKRLLGRGGMGAVYEVEDTVLGRRVALKVIMLAQGTVDSQGGEAKTRLLREARAAAALEHPNVVSIYDVGEHDGSPFFAMELVPGVSLRERMRTPSTLDEKLRWLTDIGEALIAAHDKGIVHRDIKPENVIAKPDGHAKVLDFGIARRPAVAVDPNAPTAASDNLGTITVHGRLVGTPLYMSPEQLHGDTLDGRSDEFSWGVVAYELFSGKLPWDAKDAVSLIASILAKDAPSLGDAAPDLPKPLVAVVERALTKQADGRYASMREVLVALKAASAPVLDKKRPLWALGATAIVAMGIAATLTVRLLDHGATTKPSATTTTTTTTTTASAAPTANASANADPTRGIAITDLPLPTSAIPDALEAYRAGMQALRDGSLRRSRNYFQTARKLDPSMSSAYFRNFYPWTTDAAEVMRQALDHRAGLGEHERLLIDAVAPCAQHRAGADRHCVERLRELTRKSPRDAEYSLWLSMQLNVAGQMKEAHAEAIRAVTLDPKYGLAWSWAADAAWYLGDFALTKREYESCAAVAPSVNCVIGQARLALQVGDASGAEAAAQAALNLDPSSAIALDTLREAYACAGRPEAMLREVSERYEAGLPEAEREGARLADATASALRQGDFAEALRLHDDRKRLEMNRAEVASGFAFEATVVGNELGKLEIGADAARAYLDRRIGLVNYASDDDSSLVNENVGAMLRALRRAGRISQADLREERDRWLAEWEPRIGPDYRPYLWLAAYPPTVGDEKDAEEALAALPRFGGLPRAFKADPGQALAGRTYQLANQLDEAIRLLEGGTRACFGTGVFAIESSLWLGEAREAKGDKPGACDAYAAVLKRWGHAKPKSTTADEASKRSKALGCAK